MSVSSLPVRVLMLLMNPFTHDTRVHREASALAAAGHEVEVLALGRPGLPAREERSGYRVLRLSLRGRPRRGRLLAPLVKFVEFSLRARSHAAAVRPEVVHAHDANTLTAGWLAARRVGAKLLYDAHELESGRSFAARQISGLYEGLTVGPEKAFIRRADAVVTTTDACAERLAGLYGIQSPVVVRNVADWDPPPRTDRLRAALGIPGDQRIALYEGGVIAGRGIEAFLDAAEGLTDVTPVVMGDGALLPGLREQADSGRWRRVRFHPLVPMEELAAHVASADVGVVLTEPVCDNHRVNLPNKLFEYMQGGLPVVASDLPGLGGFVREHGVGEVVDPADACAVAAAIGRMARDGEPRRRALEAVARTAPRHHWNEEKGRLVQVYESFAAP